jgi:hypothetical protein
MSPTSLDEDKASREKAIESTILHELDKWMEEIGPISDVKEMVSQPAYRRIVALGEPAVPVILRHLNREPSLLAWALFDITRINPVRPPDYGNIEGITKAWLKWGKKNKYI